MNWQSLLNPFSKFSEKHLLLTGSSFFILNVVLCYYTGVVNDAVFHYSKSENSDLFNIIKINTLSNIIMIFVMFTIGKIMNNRTRIIDIINTVFIAQIPLVIIVPLNKVPFVEDTLKTVSKIDPSTTQSLPIADLIFLSVYGFITILFLVYSFALIYNGFKTATNCKKWQQVVLFCFIVFLTISVSQIIL